MVFNPAHWLEENRGYVRAAGTIDLVYLFSCVGDRLWAFAIGFFVADLGGLPWVALGQLFDSGLKCLLLPAVGAYLDRGNRHTGMQIILAVNNLSIAASSVLFFFSLSETFGEGPINTVLLLLALTLNGFSRVASEAQKQSFLKDWIVEVVKACTGAELSTHNMICGLVDQGASGFAPVICGAIMYFFGKPTSALLFMGWNLVSWIIEALVVRNLYYRTEELRKKDENPKPTEESTMCYVGFESLPVYWRQSCVRPMFALALLFMTVLGFDNLAIAYGTEQNVSPLLLGGFRTAGALLGTAGVISYKVFSSCGVNLVLTGLIGLVLQNIMLNFTTVSIFLPGNQFDLQGYASNFTFGGWIDTALTKIYSGKEKNVLEETGVLEISPSLLLFFIGLTGARYGLWLADNSIQEIIQTSVPESERNRVNLAQNSLQEMFSFLKDFLVICFPLAQTFGALIVMSVSFVFAGLLLYISYFITEGRPIRRPMSSRPDDVEMVMVPRLEFKVTEPGQHPELTELLEKSEANGVEKEAPLQTSRTEGL